MVCEICGRKGNFKEVYVEGALVEVCNVCLSRINVDKRSSYEKGRVEVKRAVKFREEDVVEDYNILIKEGREKKGLSQKELASLLGVKESYIKHIEEGKFPPELAIAKKLEKVLGIRLVERVEYGEESTLKRSTERDKGILLEDLVEFSD